MLRKAFSAALATMSLSVAAHAQMSPLKVFEAYVAAVNSGDMRAVAELIGPEPGRPPRNFCPAEMPNRDCLLSYLQMTVVTQHTELRKVATRVLDATVAARLEVRNDLTRAAGVERFTGTDHISVKAGKIVDFAFVPDEHDAQTVKFFQYMRKTLRSQPGGGPPSGSLPGDAPTGDTPPKR